MGINEGLQLHVKDLDFYRGAIVVREGALPQRSVGSK